jgi:hypothetical protein
MYKKHPNHPIKDLGTLLIMGVCEISLIAAFVLAILM